RCNAKNSPCEACRNTTDSCAKRSIAAARFGVQPSGRGTGVPPVGSGLFRCYDCHKSLPWGRRGKPMLVGIKHELEPVGDIELVIDGGQVVADRGFGNEEPPGELPCLQPFAHQDDYFPLPLRESGDSGGSFAV